MDARRHGEVSSICLSNPQYEIHNPKSNRSGKQQSEEEEAFFPFSCGGDFILPLTTRPSERFGVLLTSIRGWS
jgi:hypothetical protein